MKLGWVDFSKTERSKILSVLDLLTQKGTLDELGISPIRDGFANLFFPGTSTIQTRAKYFFIIPYACKDLELSNETVLVKALKKLEETERKCGEALFMQNESENGIIGKLAIKNGKWVQRNPSDIYWAGLRKYGIFLGGKMSLTEYLNATCNLKNKKSTLKSLGNRNDSAEENEADDKNAGNLYSKQFWNIPLYKNNWFDTISMSLTSEEGVFLKERIIETCPDTVIAYILKHNIRESLNCKSFREFGALIGEFPEHIQESYRLALAFSDFNYVMSFVYNIMVSGENEKWESEDFQSLIEDMPTIAEVDIDYIFLKLCVIKPDLKSFLKQMQSCMKGKNIESMKKHIKDREIFLKGAARAKTTHPGEFSGNWFGGTELDYRFSNAKVILRDIFESEENVNA